MDALFFTLALLPAFLLRETGYGHIVGCCHIADLSLFCFFIGQLFHRPGQCTEVADTLSPAVEKGAIQTRLLLLLKNFLITNLYLRNYEKGECGDSKNSRTRQAEVVNVVQVLTQVHF